MSDNSSDEEVLVLTLALAAAEEEEQEEKQWMHPICASREQEGEYFTLFPHLKRDDKKFFQYFRMLRQIY